MRTTSSACTTSKPGASTGAPRFPAIEALDRGAPVDAPGFEVVHADEVVRIFGQQPVEFLPFAQLPLTALQCFLGLLSVFNIETGSKPFDDTPLLVAERRGANQEPVIYSVSPPQAHFVFIWNRKSTRLNSSHQII